MFIGFPSLIIGPSCTRPLLRPDNATLKTYRLGQHDLAGLVFQMKCYSSVLDVILINTYKNSRLKYMVAVLSRMNTGLVV